MKRILKHRFEAVSLLTAENGLMNVTIVPAVGQPDWVIPTNLILDIVEYPERIWTYLWRDQEVALFHLLPRDQTPTQIVVLEGSTDVHRVGLQFTGDLQHKKVRISDVKDVPLPEQYWPQTAGEDAVTPVTLRQGHYDNQEELDIREQAFDEKFSESAILSYLFECVEIDGKVHLIPDLDKISHHLVDLDS